MGIAMRAALTSLAGWAGWMACVGQAVGAMPMGGSIGGVRQPETSPDVAKSAAEIAAERERAAKYPVDRDYRRERVDLVVRMQGGRGHNSDNGWGQYRGTVSQVAGVARYALDASPVLAKHQQDHPGVASSGDDLLWAAGGRRPELGPELAAEGERVIEQFLSSTIVRSLDDLVGETRYFPPIDPAEPAAAILMPQLGDSRWTARFNSGRMLLAMKKGDEKELIRAAQHNYAVSRAVTGDAITISHLVAHAIDAVTMTRMTEFNLEKPLSPGVCAGMLGIMTEFPGANFEMAMRGEGLYCLDTINWVYTKGSIKDLTGDSGDGAIESLKEAGQRALWVTREAALEQAEQYFENLSRMFDPDPAVAAASKARVDEVLQKVKDDRVFKATHTPFVLMVGAAEAILRQERLARTQRAALRTMFAVELHKHRHGSYPDTIDAVREVAGGELRDWFVADGATLRYKRVDPKTDRLGRSYLIYSVGADGVDNGGAEDLKLLTAAISGPKKEGLDLVFNWREAKEETTTP